VKQIMEQMLARMDSFHDKMKADQEEMKEAIRTNQEKNGFRPSKHGCQSSRNADHDGSQDGHQSKGNERRHKMPI
jgi:hypothetical protein